MSSLIDNKFKDWTRGLSQEEARVNIYRQIQDIPYAVVLDHFDPEKGPERMLSDNKGSCVPKHYLLGLLYNRLGIGVRYHTYAFKWDEMDIVFPKNVRALILEIPETYHLACKVLVGSKWVLVDATWDLSLKSTGLPVNDKWDGYSDTMLAVNPFDEFVHENIEEREKCLEEKLREYGLPEKLKLSRFAIEFNKWLETFRHRA
ncbi:MAG: hypothetical protein ABH862_06840 [Candidatus Omnitrophota bacterium]